MINRTKVLNLIFWIPCILFSTSCRDSSGKFFIASGNVLVINETKLPDGSRDCLRGDVFAPNNIEGAPLTTIETCDDLTSVSARAGQFFVRVFGVGSGQELFSNFISVEPNKLTTLTIVQHPVLLPLTVHVRGKGNGSVNSFPLGIECGNDCEQFYQSGTVVQLHAYLKDQNSLFAGWTGACSGSQTSCEVTVSEIKKVTATFTRKLKASNVHELSILLSGNGSGTVRAEDLGVACDETCSKFIQTDTKVTLIPTADLESLFVGWTGACSGLGTCTVTLLGPLAVEAKFVKLFRVEETPLASKSYNPFDWEIFDRGFPPQFENNALGFTIPDDVNVTRGCSGNQWVTLRLVYETPNASLNEIVCIYRDTDPNLDDRYFFTLCTSAEKYDTECATVIDGERCSRADNGVRPGDHVQPLEIELFLNDGDRSCGTTEIQLPADANNPGDDGNNGDNGNHGNGNNGDNGNHGNGNNGDNGNHGDGNDGHNDDSHEDGHHGDGHDDNDDHHGDDHDDEEPSDHGQG